MTDRTYPDTPAGPFHSPPVSFTDREERDIEIRVADGTDFANLVEMYLDFDPGDRAQGIPPVVESRIREWLETLLTPECLNVIAWHEHGNREAGGDGDRDAKPDAAIGHAMLVPDDEGAYELAVFVLGEYQNAGIGTRLLEALLGLGRVDGVGTVWLTVERWNDPAIALYRKLGFEPADTDSFELEMSIRLLDR